MTRFGVVLIAEEASGDAWAARCRRAEALGYDVIAVPDHLNLLAPFPTALLAAEATERATIGTYVLNASFHHRTLLAREVTTTAALIGDRLELGLGAGYVASEFAAAGLPFDPAVRAARLEELVDGLEEGLGGRRPPLLIGGHGDRVLRLAARRADIVSFTGAPYRPEYGRTALVTADELLRRVEYVRTAAGERRPELNVLSKSTVLTRDRRAGVESLRRYAPDLTAEELLEVPTLFAGTPSQIAEQVRRNEERFGFSYVTVTDSAMEDFGKVIEHLR
ncbi:TIGR03621 family F420-dependent LLM class oxidoreductase [Planomonospora venezuelensis]|uniref:Putative F420-dependent oxidoreductase n=1 Tax=Planomonospora venezuelensis TaxID=1999 RepID=A0A841CYQ8_PLAVE|nr:TIGR03621 family F420-dependent LLM class oxidoreductase [Planomonospora venezuelensis]MBB5961933.1 putative F420-dependent oxidoreductase [Planomonospora venezuelensis]GIM98957.1 LLM class F420-dependent oxidoreductase [Planomonospora venezuelensis]